MQTSSLPPDLSSGFTTFSNEKHTLRREKREPWKCAKDALISVTHSTHKNNHNAMECTWYKPRVKAQNEGIDRNVHVFNVFVRRLLVWVRRVLQKRASLMPLTSSVAVASCFWLGTTVTHLRRNGTESSQQRASVACSLVYCMDQFYGKDVGRSYTITSRKLSTCRGGF